MELLTHPHALAGSDRDRDFEGRDHGEEIFVVNAQRGTFTVDGSHLEAGPEDIVVAAAGTAHRFVNSGSDQVRLTAERG